MKFTAVVAVLAAAAGAASALDGCSSTNAIPLHPDRQVGVPSDACIALSQLFVPIDWDPEVDTAGIEILNADDANDAFPLVVYTENSCNGETGNFTLEASAEGYTEVGTPVYGVRGCSIMVKLGGETKEPEVIVSWSHIDN